MAGGMIAFLASRNPALQIANNDDTAIVSKVPLATKPVCLASFNSALQSRLHSKLVHGCRWYQDWRVR